MNKVIDTSTRLFWAIVGPSGSGKTELIFKLLKGKTFYPKFQRAIYFYKEIQPIYSEKSNTHSIDLTFIKFSGFDSLRNLGFLGSHPMLADRVRFACAQHMRDHFGTHSCRRDKFFFLPFHRLFCDAPLHVPK